MLRIPLPSEKGTYSKDESSEERGTCLGRTSLHRQERFVSETPEEKGTRLDLCQQERLVSETLKGREICLGRISLSQQERRASESLEDTETQRQQDRKCQVPEALNTSTWSRV